jgi:hypothetical protein
MDTQLQSRIDALEKKLDAVYASVEKTRKYILVMVIATVITLVLPLVGALFIIPSIMSNYSNYSVSLEGL